MDALLCLYDDLVHKVLSKGWKKKNFTSPGSRLTKFLTNFHVHVTSCIKRQKKIKQKTLRLSKESIAN